MTVIEEHDKAYSDAVEAARKRYATMDGGTLQKELAAARQRYRNLGPTHEAVASCEVIVELLSKPSHPEPSP